MGLGGLFSSVLSIILIVVFLVCVGGFIAWQKFKIKKNPLQGRKVFKDIKQPTVIESETSDVPLNAPVDNPVTGSGSEPQSTKKAGYSSMVFTDEGIRFGNIKEKVDTVCYLEPSMPHHGPAYLAVKKGKKILRYDPREEPVFSEHSPQAAFDAINWYKDVNAVYANKLGLWDKINTLLLGLMAVGCFITMIVALDR